VRRLPDSLATISGVRPSPSSASRTAPASTKAMSAAASRPRSAAKWRAVWRLELSQAKLTEAPKASNVRSASRLPAAPLQYHSTHTINGVRPRSSGKSSNPSARGQPFVRSRVVDFVAGEEIGQSEVAAEAAGQMHGVAALDAAVLRGGAVFAQRDDRRHVAQAHRPLQSVFFQ